MASGNPRPGPSSAMKGNQSRDRGRNDAGKFTGHNKSVLCTICGAKACPTIKKDSDFENNLALYWATVGLDVKPSACSKLCDLCVSCYEEVGRYADTNDILVCFENKSKIIRADLVERQLKEIMSRAQEDKPMNKIQERILLDMQKLQATAEMDKEISTQTLKNTFNIEEFEIVKDDDDDDSSDNDDINEGSSRSAIRISRKHMRFGKQ